MKKQGITLPESSGRDRHASSPVQKVVKLELIPEEKAVPAATTLPCNAYSAVNYVAFEVVTHSATIRVFNNTDAQMLENLFHCLGGVLNAG